MLKLNFSGILSRVVIRVDHACCCLVMVNNLHSGASFLHFLLESVNLFLRLFELFVQGLLSGLLILEQADATLEVSLLFTPKLDVIEVVAPEFGLVHHVWHKF